MRSCVICLCHILTFHHSVTSPLLSRYNLISFIFSTPFLLLNPHLSRCSHNKEWYSLLAKYLGVSATSSRKSFFLKCFSQCSQDLAAKTRWKLFVSRTSRVVPWGSSPAKVLLQMANVPCLPLLPRPKTRQWKQLKSQETLASSFDPVAQKLSPIRSLKSFIWILSFFLIPYLWWNYFFYLCCISPLASSSLNVKALACIPCVAGGDASRGCVSHKMKEGKLCVCVGHGRRHFFSSHYLMFVLASVLGPHRYRGLNLGG